MFEDRKENLPEICVGFDELYYSEKLINFIKSYFESLGYSVQFNYPYSGTMIPNKFFETKVDNLYSVMIEINKNIYLTETNKKNSNCEKLRKQIKKLLEYIKNLEI